MRHITQNLLNSARNSNLYCVWVQVQDEGRERLAAIWIDPAMTAFKPCAQESTSGIGTAAIVAEPEERRRKNLEMQSTNDDKPGPLRASAAVVRKRGSLPIHE